MQGARDSLSWVRHAAILLSLSLRGWAGGTVYIDGPNATDAQRIATQMLNDAASGRWRNEYKRPTNPYDQMIADYERRQRERALEMEEGAVRARQRLAERAAEAERMREEQALNERNARAARARVRIDALAKEATELRPMSHVRLGMLLEAGRYEPGQLTFADGMTAETYARARYEQAAKLDLPLGEVAMACFDRGDQPRFPALWDALQALPDGPAMRALLERHASAGHVGAAFWLGMWAGGYEVGLGRFPAPASPAEMWVLLQCAIRAHERGGVPDLASWVKEAKDLRPREVPVRGAMLLARLAFSKGPVVRDSADRRGLPHAYGSMVRAAWRDPALWAETAALVEVMQIDPLEPDQWRAGWLGSWMEVDGTPGDKARAWAALLMRPDSSTWRAAHGPGWAPELESLSLRPAGQLPAPVAALRASLRLRAAEGGSGVESAFRALVSLGGEGHWHAQALLEDFGTRYRAAYARRGESAVFTVHARKAAELIAGWRATGSGFCRRNAEGRWRAVGRAIEAGSTQFNRAELEKAARDGSEAAQVAIHRLDAMASAQPNGAK